MKEFFDMIVSNKEWLFDGIVTEIITLVAGGAIGFGICVRFRGHQKQVAKNNAKQEQELSIEDTTGGKEKNAKSNIQQKQRAGHGSTQFQKGRIKRGE